MISATAIIWNAGALLGACSLLLLLGTFYFVKTLPQRKNPYLVNLILTSFLATIPPLLLLFTGQLGKIPVKWICTLQAASMDGDTPMFGSAMVVLAFQTWSEMRAHTRGRTCLLVRFVYLKWVFISAPYIMFVGWFATSLTAMLQPSAKVALDSFVFCTYEPPDGPDPIRHAGYFMVACMGMAMLLEVWIAVTVYLCLRRCRVSQDLRQATSVIYSTIYMCVRLFIFTVIQLSPILLTVLHNRHIDPLKHRRAMQIMRSMYSLSVFVVFGTQRTVLQAWKVLPPTTQVEKPVLT